MMKRIFLLQLWLFSASVFAGGTITLGNVKGGAVPILRELSGLRFPDLTPRNQVCVAINGVRADVLEQAASEDMSVVWVKVRVASGNCAGASGWVNLENIKLE